LHKAAILTDTCGCVPEKNLLKKLHFLLPDCLGSLKKPRIEGDVSWVRAVIGVLFEFMLNRFSDYR
jgi:hypothetical protein